MSALNLDHAATTPLLPDAAEAMARVEADAPGNPSSAHQLGRKARQFLEDAREKVAHLLDAKPEEVLFTSGATEANNLAIFGLAGDPPGVILASRLEHSCIIEPLKVLEVRGFTVDWLPVRPDGTVDPAMLSRNSTARFATVMLANHETGVVQDVKRMVGAVPFHCDAAAAVGKMPVSFHDLGVRSLSLSAHKFGGPKGVGSLLLKEGMTLPPMMYGGHQQRGLRPGTESPALAVGLATALELSIANLEDNVQCWRGMRAELIRRLQAEAPPVVINGDRLANIVNLSFPGCRGDLLMMALDLAGIACSTGSACSSGSLLPSPVLQAMNVPEEVLISALRFSFGTGAIDLDEAIERITFCVAKARR